jgi:hypothetical protein
VKSEKNVISITEEKLLTINHLEMYLGVGDLKEKPSV